MRAKFFCMGLLAGMFALLTECAVANALTTVPETELFNLTTNPEVTFLVSNDDGTITNNNNGPVINSQILTFNKFDPTLGTLTGVTITFTTEYGATVTVTATNGSFENDIIDFFSDATIGHDLTGSLISSQSSPQLLSANCATDSETNGGSCTDSQSSNNNPFDGTAGLAASLASFSGPGTYDLTATLTSALAPRITPDNGTGFADNSTFGGTLTASWNGSVSVVYTYDAPVTAVPEPLSLYLLVAGLSGIALSRRRRR